MNAKDACYDLMRRVYQCFIGMTQQQMMPCVFEAWNYAGRVREAELLLGILEEWGVPPQPMDCRIEQETLWKRFLWRVEDFGYQKRLESDENYTMKELDRYFSEASEVSKKLHRNRK